MFITKTQTSKDNIVLVRVDLHFIFIY